MIIPSNKRCFKVIVLSKEWSIRLLHIHLHLGIYINCYWWWLKLYAIIKTFWSNYFQIQCLTTRISTVEVQKENCLIFFAATIIAYISASKTVYVVGFWETKFSAKDTTFWNLLIEFFRKVKLVEKHQK